MFFFFSMQDETHCLMSKGFYLTKFWLLICSYLLFVTLSWNIGKPTRSFTEICLHNFSFICLCRCYVWRSQMCRWHKGYRCEKRNRCSGFRFCPSLFRSFSTEIHGSVFWNWRKSELKPTLSFLGYFLQNRTLWMKPYTNPEGSP